MLQIKQKNNIRGKYEKDYNISFKFVNDSWLSALTEIYCGDEVYKTVIEDLGEDWLAVMLNWSMEKFCEYFDGWLYLDSVEVYEVA